ncbi:MAG: ubiquinol-cytochrome c reductase iron-sulfur subunit [Bacteroidales bacterium]
MKTNRREFIRKAGLASACVCTGLAGVNGCTMIGGISRTPEIDSGAWTMTGDKLVIDLAKVESLRKAGGSGKLTVIDQVNGEETKVIIIHHSEGEFKAFPDCCTHGCRELNYLHDKGQLECSSFGKSTFSLQGPVIKGPAEEPLEAYDLLYSENEIIIDLSA